MKSKFLTMFFAAIAVTLSAQMPRSEWHAKVGECALDPAALTATISQLSSKDKTAFIAEINEAISKMPGSPEAKAAQFLTINRAAVRGVGPADRAAVLAEVFATVPPEALAVIHEEFAKSEFARPDAMSDERYKSIISGAMEKIVQRCASAESGAVRSGFAGLMFIRAAGPSAQEDVQAAVIAALPAEAQLEARNTWFPAALGKDQVAASYDSMLGAAQAGEEADHQLTVSMYSQQIVESMLSDLQTTHQPGEQIGKIERGTTPVDFFNSQTDAMGVKDPLPTRGAAADKIINQALITGRPEDSNKQIENPWYGGDEHTEPGPYWGQNP